MKLLCLTHLHFKVGDQGLVFDTRKLELLICGGQFGDLLDVVLACGSVGELRCVVSLFGSRKVR